MSGFEKCVGEGVVCGIQSPLPEIFCDLEPKVTPIETYPISEVKEHSQIADYEARRLCDTTSLDDFARTFQKIFSDQLAFYCADLDWRLGNDVKIPPGPYRFVLSIVTQLYESEEIGREREEDLGLAEYSAKILLEDITRDTGDWDGWNGIVDRGGLLLLPIICSRAIMLVTGLGNTRQQEKPLLSQALGCRPGPSVPIAADDFVRFLDLALSPTEIMTKVLNEVLSFADRGKYYTKNLGLLELMIEQFKKVRSLHGRLQKTLGESEDDVAKAAHIKLKRLANAVRVELGLKAIMYR